MVKSNLFLSKNHYY
ncbi:Protein of unknown function [Lactobacillus delbrueckii subsp. lactis]|nr:Putative uncharacterized protein [Lactobacillus delbrueckii subsp. lactis]CDR81290.1 Protein of unknown function [Lactobacillus delbrueckii subsp. lactis]CDR83444.1 Protein of unknown function [Lactobacillus delbrueckii subsp. lactis]